MPKEEQPTTFATQKKTRTLTIIVAIGLLGAVSIFAFFWFWNPSNKTGKTAVPSVNNKTGPSWVSADRAANDGTIAPAGPILEVNLVYDRSADPIISIETAYKKNGHAPLVDPTDQGYTLQVLDREAKVLVAQDFSIPNTVVDPPPQAGEAAGPAVILPRVNFTMTLPWTETAADVRVLDADQSMVTTKSLADVQTVDRQPNFRTIRGSDFLHPISGSPQSRRDGLIRPAQAQAETPALDITFIGDNYLTAADLDIFYNDVNRFISSQLTYYPFKGRASQILFHVVANTSDLGCEHYPTTPRLITCNSTLVYQAVNNAGVPYDKIAVIVKDSNYGGGGGRFAISYNGASGPQVYVHEFGHTLGAGTPSLLVDEYDSHGTSGPIYNSGYYNCLSGQPPWAGWNGIVGTLDYQGVCSYPNWFEPSQGSIMKALSYPFFNAVSQRMLNTSIDYYAGPLADTIPPAVALTSPSAGTTVGGTVTVDSTATDATGVAWAALWVDGIMLNTDYAEPFRFTWQTATIAAGNHTVQIKAYDSAGNVGESALTTVNVGTATDQTAPVVSITSPMNNSTVSGTIAVAANATDNTGVAGVQFKVDGINLGVEDIFAPYSVSWDSASSGNGSHTLTAVARDPSGNSTISSPVTVTISVPLAISGVSTSNVTTTSSTIKWTTNTASTGTVTLATGQSLTDSNSSTSHSVSFTGLIKSTRYNFTISTTSLNNGTATSNGSFRTKNK